MFREMMNTATGRAKASPRSHPSFLVFEPLMALDRSAQDGISVLDAVRFFVDPVSLAFKVQTLEQRRMKELGQIQRFDQDLSRVPPVPEAEGVEHALVAHGFDRTQPRIPEDDAHAPDV